MPLTQQPCLNSPDINGLTPLKDRIYLSPPDLSEEEKAKVAEALQSNWVAPEGPFIHEFEKQLSDFLGVEHSVALNSGTSAIHLGLKYLGVAAGDYVLVPTFSFCAAVNPVLYLGASPVFVDCEAETWGIDPALIEKAIVHLKTENKMPKAIVMVHSYGMPAQIDDIKQLADQYDIPVLEDAAESLGATHGGEQTGCFGAVSVVSFNGNKLLTTGGGGSLVVPDKEAYNKVLKWATQSKEDLPYYHHTEIGFNYRMSNVAAAVGLGQFQNLDKRLARKRDVYRRYCEEFNGFNDLEIFGIDNAQKSNHWLTILLLPEKSKVTNIEMCEILAEKGVETRPVWQPLHRQPLYQNHLNFLNGTSEQLFSRGLCLPSGSSLSKDQQNIVIEMVNNQFAIK